MLGAEQSAEVAEEDQYDPAAAIGRERHRAPAHAGQRELRRAATYLQGHRPSPPASPVGAARGPRGYDSLRPLRAATPAGSVQMRQAGAGVFVRMVPGLGASRCIWYNDAVAGRPAG